jgi:hypothetical protein
MRNLNEISQSINAYRETVRRTTDVITNHDCSSELLAKVSSALNNMDINPRYTQCPESILAKNSKIMR